MTVTGSVDSTLATLAALAMVLSAAWSRLAEKGWKNTGVAGVLGTGGLPMPKAAQPEIARIAPRITKFRINHPFNLQSVMSGPPLMVSICLIFLEGPHPTSQCGAGCGLTAF